MSTTLVMSSVAAQQAAQAEAAAKRAECVIVMDRYQPSTATVAQMQQYGDCVNRLYPNEMSPSSVIALKVALLAILLCGVAMAIRESRSDYLGMRLENAFMGFLVGCCGGFFCCLVVAALIWIIT